MENENLDCVAIRAALLTRLVMLSLSKAGYEHAEPLLPEEVHAIVNDAAEENCHWETSHA